MTVNRIIVHSDFNRRHFMGSDIALLQLHLSVNFTSHILPACLPEPTTDLPSHTSCWITGWGMVTEDGRFWGSPRLQAEQYLVSDGAVQLEPAMPCAYKPQCLYQAHLLLQLDP
nr:hypothetical protein HJG63_010204 [Rousettus aegyptiacus]